jgi:long-chain fatty acid transport protein
VPLFLKENGSHLGFQVFRTSHQVSRNQQDNSMKSFIEVVVSVPVEQGASSQSDGKNREKKMFPLTEFLGKFSLASSRFVGMGCGVVLLLCVQPVYGSGNRLITQSSAGTALAGACIAQLTGPDAVYWNPANMVDLGDEEHGLEAGLNYTHVPAQDYEDNRGSAYNGASEPLDSFRPAFFYSSADYQGWRWGLSLTSPFGLSKEWREPFPATFAKEYSLKTMELNPSFAYAVNSVVSVGGGVRLVYGEAEVENGGVLPTQAGAASLFRSMEGDAAGLGYNLAVTVKPLERLRLGLTYRSKVELDLEGDAALYGSSTAGSGSYIGPGSVEYPLPAVLALGIAYTIDKTTVELGWDRTYWSEYEALDFEYPQGLSNSLLSMLFDTPIAKNWEDTSAYRLGVSHILSDTVTLMAGVAYDETPAPDATLLFELPDSDMFIYALGGKWRVSDSTTLAVAYLYSDKEDRAVKNTWLDGEFSNSQAHVVTMGVTYVF